MMLELALPTADEVKVVADCWLNQSNGQVCPGLNGGALLPNVASFNACMKQGCAGAACAIPPGLHEGPLRH